MCVCVACSESLAQVMDVGFKMIDSPVHLADFGKNNFMNIVLLLPGYLLEGKTIHCRFYLNS